jgi:hypothetical protein
VVFLVALIALTALAAYHISVLIRLDAAPRHGRMAGE